MDLYLIALSILTLGFHPPVLPKQMSEMDGLTLCQLGMPSATITEIATDSGLNKLGLFFIAKTPKVMSLMLKNVHGGYYLLVLYQTCYLMVSRWPLQFHILLYLS